MTKKSEKDAKPLPFEKALARLEEIVEKLDDGNLPLSESLELFKEGTQLAKTCRAQLTEAERQVKEALEEVEAAKPEAAAIDAEESIEESFAFDAEPADDDEEAVF